MTRIFRFGRRLGTLAVLGVVAACSQQAPVAEPIRAVKVLTVQPQATLGSAQYAGEVRAQVESRLGFRVAGKLVQRSAQVGQRVRVGQVLAQVDAQDYELALQGAKAQVLAARASHDLAAADLQRFVQLRAQNFISGAELERREVAWKAAQAQLEQALASERAQGNQAAYTLLTASVSGVVTAVDAEVGQVLAAGTPVVRIAQDGARDAVFAIAEDRLGALPVGSRVQVRAWSGPPVRGARVREVAASADPVTRTFSVKAQLDAEADLPLGATVTVTSDDRAAQSTLLLPTAALRQEGQRTAVWVLDPVSMTVRSQEITVDGVQDQAVVVGAGLRAGMQVVVAGVHGLVQGQKVSVYKEKSPAALVPYKVVAPNRVVANASAPAAIAQ